MRFVWLQSFVGIAVGTHWVCPSRLGVRHLRGIPGYAVSAFLRSRNRPLLPFSSSSEFHPAFPAVVCKRRSPSLGSCSSSRYQCWSPLSDEPPEPILCSALSVSRTLDGLLLPHRVGLFRPTTTSKIFSSGVFPDNQPAKLSPARTLLSLTLQAASRLQGFVQLSIRSTCVRFTFRWPRSPPEFLLPRVFLNAP